jgi:hypothetical protein
MNKVNGKKTSFAPVREDGSRITICYGLKKLSGDLYEWFEVYLPKKQTAQLTFDVVKQAILADINDKVKTAIISGFVWNDKPVWFSEENQLNFTQGVVPVTFKIGEQEDGTPIYHEFTTAEDLKAFNDACIAWKQQCLTNGYAEKDSIEWTPYQQTFETETA